MSHAKLGVILFALLFFLVGCNLSGMNVQGPAPSKQSAGYHKQGPPPHAPAHGYRHKHQHGHDMEYNSDAGAYVQDS